MELIENILNIVAPPITLMTLFLFVPPFHFFKFLFSIFTSFFPSENLASKVVLITGASSGIGQHLAYEYARRGACLSLVARREDRLHQVANTARFLGSPEVIVFPADITNSESTQRFIQQTVSHFVDHLVNNAGIATKSMVEEFRDIKNAAPVMETNFWGSVYSTYFAIPHLRNSKGKIIGIASAAGWLHITRLAFYSASKAAVISFYETLRLELGKDIGITIVTPGLIESEMSQGKFLNEEGRLELDQVIRDVQISALPVEPVEKCAKAIVDSACRGDRYLAEPPWIKVTWFWKAFLPEVVDWCNRIFLMTRRDTPPTETLSKKILDLTGAKRFMYPPSIQSPEL